MVADLFNCDRDVLDDRELLEAVTCRAAESSGATILNLVSHQFDPYGVTVLVLLAESHLSIHTWPERGQAHVDAFTCGSSTDPDRAVDHLVSAMGAQQSFRAYLDRPMRHPPRFGDRFWKSLLNLWN